MIDPRVAPPQDIRTLRQFGLLVGTLCAAMLGGLRPWILGKPLPAWPWLLGGVVVALSFLAPRALRQPYRGWMRLGHALGACNAVLILGGLFFLVLTPLAVAMRLAGRDRLGQRWDRGATSYRTVRGANAVGDMRRMF